MARDEEEKKPVNNHPRILTMNKRMRDIAIRAFVTIFVDGLCPSPQGGKSEGGF